MPFTDAPWSSPESDLDPSAYCSVCLTDLNPPGAEKVKAKCFLPIRSRPGAPINKNALRNASARLNQASIPAAERKKAAAKLVRMMREAGMTVGESMMRMAGMR